MPYDFPTAPALGTIVTVPDGSYRVWDSTKWRAAPSGSVMYPPNDTYLPLIGGTVNGDVTITGSAASGNTGTYLTLTGGISTFLMNAALGKGVRITAGGAATGFNIAPGGTATDNPFAITMGASAGLHAIDMTNSKVRTKYHKTTGAYALALGTPYSDDTAPLSMAMSFSGKSPITAGGYPFMRWGVTGDWADCGDSAGAQLIQISHQWGGASNPSAVPPDSSGLPPTMTGGRQAMLIHLQQVAQTNNPNYFPSNPPGDPDRVLDANYQSLTVTSDVAYNEGGLGLTHETAMGHNFAFGTYARMLATRSADHSTVLNAATNWYTNNGCEWDNLVQTGCSVMRNFGFDIVHLKGHAVQGSLEDAAIMIADQQSDPVAVIDGGHGPTIGWKTIFQVGSPLGQDPLGVGSGIMQWRAPRYDIYKVPQADFGIDISMGAISGKAFASRNFAVMGSGDVNIYQGTIGQNAAGVTIDVHNYVVRAQSLASGVGSAGSVVGEYYGDPVTGIIVRVATIAGGVDDAVSSITSLQVGYAASAPPSPITLTKMAKGYGDGSITVNVVTTLNNMLTLQPGGGDVAAPNGMQIGNVLAAAINDTSKHLVFDAANDYGINLTSGAINIVAANTAAVSFSATTTRVRGNLIVDGTSSVGTVSLPGTATLNIGTITASTGTIGALTGTSFVMNTGTIANVGQAGTLLVGTTAAAAAELLNVNGGIVLGGTAGAAGAGGTIYVKQTGGTAATPLIITNGVTTPAVSTIGGSMMVLSGTAGASMRMEGFGNPIFAMRTSGGAQGAPTALAANALLGQITWEGWDGTALGAQQSIIQSSAAGAWTTANHGTFMDFYVTKNGTTAFTQAIRIGYGATAPTPTLTMGSSTTTDNLSTLLVNGNVKGTILGEGITNSITLTGSSQATALALTTGLNVLTNVPATSGGLLPQIGSVVAAGTFIDIINSTTTAAKVYGVSPATIDGVATATGVTLSGNARCRYWAITNSAWISTLMGAPSA